MWDRPDMETADPSQADAPHYSFRTSMMGPPHEFRLAADALEWTAGRRSGRVPYAAVQRVRLSFRPLSLQTHRFIAEIWGSGQPKLTIASTSWKSLVEQQRQDGAYRAFLTEFHRRVAAQAPGASYETGTAAFIYWPGVILFSGLLFGFAFLVVQALLEQSWAGALFIGVFGAVFVHQMGGFFWRNRPGRYDPAQMPDHILPRG